MRFSNPGIVICVEKGMLEYKALCLVLTLRENWGRWSETPIYSYSPRSKCHISPWLSDIFKAHNVTLIDKPLNDKYVEYPLANKPISMAHAESTLDHDLLVYLDSDILCWNEPTSFDLPMGKDIGLVVDGTKAVASSGPGDVNENMWQALYKLAQVEHEPFVTTALTQEKVRGWWGTGVIAVRGGTGLMTDWLSLFESAMREVPFRKEAFYLREQMTCCALASRYLSALHEMPITHNFPIQNHRVLGKRGVEAQSAALWHYQPFLNKAFRVFSECIEVQNTLMDRERVAREFIKDLWENYPRRLGLDEPLLVAWRRRLSLGPKFRAIMGRSLPTDPS